MATVGHALKQHAATFDLNQLEAEFLHHGRLSAAGEHRLYLLESSRPSFGIISHHNHQGSWKGRTSARNDHESLGWCAR